MAGIEQKKQQCAGVEFAIAVFLLKGLKKFVKFYQKRTSVLWFVLLKMYNGTNNFISISKI